MSIIPIIQSDVTLISAMPVKKGGRPRHEVDQYRTIIQSRHQDRTSIADIHTELLDHYKIGFSKDTLRRRMAAWGLKPHQKRTVNTEDLRKRIAELFFEQGLSDKQMLQYLNSDVQGFVCTLNGIEQIRKGMSLFRRRNAEQIQEARESLFRFF